MSYTPSRERREEGRRFGFELGDWFPEADTTQINFTFIRRNLERDFNQTKPKTMKQTKIKFLKSKPNINSNHRCVVCLDKPADITFVHQALNIGHNCCCENCTKIIIGNERLYKMSCM